MGKSKNKPRVKGNAQPASSSRAAEIISTSGQAPVQNLGGFAQFLSGTAFSSTSTFATRDIDSAISNTTLDPGLVLILKRLSKRDPTTKLKALEELEAYLKSKESNENELTGILDLWAKLFVKLGIDVDRRIRYATFSCHLIIVKIIKKRIAPFLKEILPVWIISLFDQSKDVARIANESFQAAFPPEKRADVLVFGQEEILSYITEMILYKTPETLSDPRFTSKEDMDSKYLRVVASSYYALAHIIGQLKEDELEKSAQQYNNLFDNNKFWANLSNDNSVVRKSCYSLIRALVNRWPSEIEKRLEMFSNTYLMKVFNDKDTSVHGDLWDSLLIFTRQFPESWLIASKKKPMLPKLYNFLRSGAYGSVNVSYPSILALIGHLPQELIDSDPKFYEEFFSNFWKGLLSPTIDRSNSNVFLKAYSECLVYCIIKLGKLENEEKQIFVVENKFFGLIEDYLVAFKSNTKFQTEQMCSTIAIHVSILFSKLQGTGALKVLSEKLEELVARVITNGTVPNPGPNVEEDYIEFSQRFSSLLVSLMPNLEDQQENNELYTMVTTLINKNFCLALNRCKENNGFSLGLNLLLLNLAKNFPNIIFNHSTTKQALDNFIETTFNNLVTNCPLSALGYLFEFFSIYLTYAQESQVQKRWHDLIRTLLEFDELKKKLERVHPLITKASNIKPSGSLINDQFNEFLIFLMNELFNDKIDATTKESIEYVLEISLLSKVSLLDQKTKLEIISHFSKAIVTFAHSYYVITEDSVIRDDVIILILRIFTKLCDDLQSMEILLESHLLPISWAIFELTFVETHEGSDSKVFKDIEPLVQNCWNQLSDTCRTHHKEDVVFNHISQKIKESILNIQYAVSPTNFAQRVIKLCTSLYQHESAISQELIAPFLLSDKEWRQLSEPLLNSFVDPSLSIIDPMIFITSNEEKQADNRFETQSNIYDTYGLSSYARLGLFVIELINKIGTTSFFCTKDVGDSSIDVENKGLTHWVLSELLLIHVLCTDIYRSRKKGHHLWDATITEESNYHGFEAFLVEFYTILKQYVKYMIQNSSINLKSLATNMKSANISEQCPIIDLSSLFIDILRRSHGKYSYCWARTLHILLTIILKELDMTIVDAEEFFEIIELESSNYNLATKMATILSLKQFIETSSKFKNFQNNLVNKLCNLNATDIFITDTNKGQDYLYLLTISTTRDDEYFLAPKRAINLLECISKWHDAEGAKLLFDPKYAHIQIQISRLFISIISQIQNSQESYWDFIFQCLQNWLKENGHLALRYEAICLFCRLTSLFETLAKSDKFGSEVTSDEGLYKCFSLYKPIIDEQLSYFFFQEKDHQKETLSEQYSEYLEILCESCQDLSKPLLINKKDELYSLFTVPHDGIQKCSFKHLHVLIVQKIMRLSEELEFTDGETLSVQFDKELISLIIQTHDTHSANTDIFTAHKIFGYLLGWMLVFDHFEYASFKVKSQLVSYLKESDITSNLFTFIFDTLGLSGSNKPYDLSKWDISEFYIEGFEIQHSFELGFSLLCAHLYYRSLKHISSIVSIWWSECKKRQLTIAIDSYTEKYFSPIIIQNQLEMLQSKDVKSQLEDEKFSIRVARSSNEVIASYIVDEYVMEISIKMPVNFPLRQAEFNTLERIGTSEVADLRWAKLPVQTVVNSRNGNLEVALNLFKNNINLRFKGVEDCPICYSVVSLDDRSLPTKKCSTCKNKFHASCLYKWFRSSNSTSCPLCRRLF
ncbi:hypothetical protein RclHR1_00250041 [Rhizophagus clarus]|uniref:E3 ubiquitin-protein ligase listerin n=1 Tax=Rhizophagus clarus TaxID=94130 RepID=A0A2Z6QYH6_9GLOM|nr:hypothetical protein RclHR1_00250041 [Rhizophagus clarus]GET00969.1 RING zinc finger protein-like protein [Rhizophagus clarus]